MSVTLADLARGDVGVDAVVAWLTESLGLGPAGRLADLVGRFDPDRLDPAPVVAPPFVADAGRGS
jgi:hypothetical protein